MAKTRNYRVVLATDDYEEFIRCSSAPLVEGQALPPVVIHRAAVQDYIKGLHVTHTLPLALYAQQGAAHYPVAVRRVLTAMGHTRGPTSARLLLAAFTDADLVIARVTDIDLTDSEDEA